MEFVYFGSRDGGVYALNATDGALGWKADIGHAVVSSPAVTEEVVYVGADNGVIYKIDIGSGHVVWQFDTEKNHGWRCRSTPHRRLPMESCILD